ncbi:MAG TPA: hypothetical protein VN029_02195 [Sphingomonas sp.]|nr:hypothetical protein [Sphingomonas sp.]
MILGTAGAALGWFVGRIGCARGKHHRNLRRVRPTEDGRYRSKCRYCSTPMLRRTKYDWIAL